MASPGSASLSGLSARRQAAGVDFDLPGPDDPRRHEIRQWLADHPHPRGEQLAKGGWVVPHWPAPYGRAADPVEQILIDQELAAARVRRPENAIGIGWAAPTILMAGTQAQKERYLWPALSGQEIWCQLFSEPDAGSDLAGLKTRATRDGEEWIVNGSKIWTSGAHHSQFGILIARTDPEAPKHRGISYFICPMDTPGIEVRPIVDMTGAHMFNQVFFTDARIPADNLVGEAGDGWRLAKATLANERVSLSSGGALWGRGPTAQDLIDTVRASRRELDHAQRQELVRVWIEGELLRLLRLRSLSARLSGRTPGPEASIQKLFADEHGQRIMAAASMLAGADGMLGGSGPSGPDGEVDPIWYYGLLFSQALTIGGGTWAVQRNIVGERVLGLPHEPGIS